MIVCHANYFSHFFQLDPSDAYVCLYDDGTIVTEEFFKTLPNNSELVVLSGDQTWTGCESKSIKKIQDKPFEKVLKLTNPVLLISVIRDVGRLLSTVLHSDGLTEAARELLSDEPAPKRRKILNDLLLNLEDRSELEKREQDEDWFKGTANSSGGRGHLHLKLPLTFPIKPRHLPTH